MTDSWCLFLLLATFLTFFCTFHVYLKSLVLYLLLNVVCMASDPRNALSQKTLHSSYNLTDSGHKLYTSLAAKGALAYRLQRRNACKI